MSQKFSTALHWRITCRPDSAVLMILCLLPSLKMDETERWYLVRTPVGRRLCGCSIHRDHYCSVTETVKEMFHSFHTTKHQAMWNFSSCGATARIWPRASPFEVPRSHFNDTHTHTYTLERPPMDERAVRRRDRKPHNTQKRHILAPEGIRTAIPASKRQQIHVLDRVINGSGDRECIYYTRSIKYVSVFSNTQQCYTKRQVNPSFIYWGPYNSIL